MRDRNVGTTFEGWLKHQLWILKDIDYMYRSLEN